MSAITDPVADLLTRIRNASRAGHEQVEIPASQLKLAIVKILAQEKFVRGYQVISNEHQGVIRVFLRYGAKREPVLSNLKRISKPGLRVYAGKTEIPRVLGGLGIVIVSTSQGIMTGAQAHRAQLGGEILAYVW
jgi:small subunit ribosomal protein S8